MELWRQLRQIIGMTAVLALLSVVLLNSLIMVISPRRWFALPGFLAFRGGMTRQRYLNTSGGRFQVRLLGLLLTGFITYMLWGIFGNTSFIEQALISGKLFYGVPLERALCVVTCVGAIGCGLMMLINPRWWAKKFTDYEQHGTDKSLIIKVIRFSSFVVLGLAVYFVLQCRTF